jgi:hypothetical protein
MDILNFISWIKGKRLVTTVDPAKTLLPVALKDGRRDDDYLTGAITVQDFIAQITPPTPPPSTNIYNSDGTLTANRTLTGNGNRLGIVSLDDFFLGANNGITFTNSGTQLNFLPIGQIVQINRSGGGPVALSIDFLNSVYQFGQVTGGNTTQLKIDDTAAYPVQVSGTNVAANAAGAASGQFLKIKVNGVDYKINLLNP